VLTDREVEQFLTKGYVKIEGAFPRKVAEEWTRDCFRRLGYDMADPSSWAETRIHMSGDKYVEVREFAPRVYDAMCDLAGEDRIQHPIRWSDHFIVNLGLRADEPWQPASPDVPGWHKDGDFFRHFLDSPEQGLLVFVNWTDVEHLGGPTYIATDSIPVLAKFLASRPDGVLPNEFDFRGLIGQCRHFEEATGAAGDVFLLHPFVLHAASQNPRRAIRIITNPPVHLSEPLNFDRPDQADFSLVERGILRALGVERLAFHPTGERERIVPERVRRQNQMRQEELAREAAFQATQQAQAVQ
jgi:hypothetical protein